MLHMHLTILTIFKLKLHMLLILLYVIRAEQFDNMIYTVRAVLRTALKLVAHVYDIFLGGIE